MNKVYRAKAGFKIDLKNMKDRVFKEILKPAVKSQVDEKSKDDTHKGVNRGP